MQRGRVFAMERPRSSTRSVLHETNVEKIIFSILFLRTNLLAQKFVCIELERKIRGSTHEKEEKKKVL